MFVFGELRQDLGRLTEIYRIMSKHGFSPKSKEHQAHLTSAPERFCAMLEELGPAFIKVGQILSTRSDLLPAEYTNVLSRLQDNVPPVSFLAIKGQIESSLQKPLEELFAYFDETPLACASIAQVHGARLEDGTEVVVKVQRPGLAAQVERDSSVLLMIAQLLEWSIEEAAVYQAKELAAEFRNALAIELDFHSEANNLLAFAKYNAGRKGVYVPKVFTDLSSREVLTMERVSGIRITDLLTSDRKSKTPQLIETLLNLFFSQVFEDGLFHADPHPGNILITDNNQIAFIDFGLIGRMTRDQQDRLLGILLALSLKDADTLAQQILHLGEPVQRVSLPAFRNTIRNLLDRYVGLSIGDIPAGRMLSEVLDAALRFHVRLPKEFALLAKASMALEGLVRQLHPELNVSSHLAKRAKDLIWERFDPMNFRDSSMRMALQLVSLAQDLPMQVSQTLLDLEHGELRFKVKLEDVSALDKTLRGLGMAICSGLVACSFVLSGTLWWIMGPTSVWPAITSFAMAGCIWFTTFAWYRMSQGPMRLSLGRLRKAFGRRFRK